MIERRVGTAGWALPRDVRDRFGSHGTQLERYAERFACVEINSSFHRSHRPASYARWAASVPDEFRFSLKLPKEITHTRRLANSAEPLARFLDESAALRQKREVVLVQLPPSLTYDAAVAQPFLESLRVQFGGKIACEPRHRSWFCDDVTAEFTNLGITRVAADPPIGAPAPGPGEAHFSYWRLHGAPRTYYTTYDDVRLCEFASAFRSARGPAWCIFDNTALGFATANASSMLEALG